MFTGIVEETGTVARIESASGSIRLAIRADLCGRGVQAGDSIAVNGCCLTVVKISARERGKILEFDLLAETLRRTNLQFAGVGAAVNLERALPAQGRIDGHFVTGHIDGVGRIVRRERRGADWLLEIEAPPEIMRLIVSKGAIAVDGISLTVADVQARSFGVWIIPHTHRVTALRGRGVGDAVNLEADILGKYVERILAENLRTRRADGVSVSLPRCRSRPKAAAGRTPRHKLSRRLKKPSKNSNRS